MANKKILFLKIQIVRRYFIVKEFPKTRQNMQQTFYQNVWVT